ncbi:MAG: hypothetical protein CML06_11670 [Pseudomonadales bacterium]|nr:hypothetical protein [Pseudomonadales bacterium]
MCRLRREHHLLQVRSPGLDQWFQSLVLEVDVSGQRLLLDEPFPHQLPAAAWQGRRLRVSTREGSLGTLFDTEVRQVLQQPEGIALVTAMPRQVEAAQRRRHFRVAVHSGMPVDAVVRLPASGNMAARVLDLSVSGVRVALPGEHEQLPAGSRLWLRLGLEDPMVAMLSACYLRPSPLLPDATEVGAHLNGLNPQQMKVLERFLFRLQRLQRQRELAESAP